MSNSSHIGAPKQQVIFAEEFQKSFHKEENFFVWRQKHGESDIIWKDIYLTAY